MTEHRPDIIRTDTCARCERDYQSDPRLARNRSWDGDESVRHVVRLEDYWCDDCAGREPWTLDPKS